MKKLLLTISLFLMAGVVNAAEIPLLTFFCTSTLSVHAEKGGPVYMNTKKVDFVKINENNYEVTDSGVTVSITISPDGTHKVAYTGDNGASGVCKNAGSGE